MTLNNDIELTSYRIAYDSWHDYYASKDEPVSVGQDRKPLEELVETAEQNSVPCLIAAIWDQRSEKPYLCEGPSLITRCLHEKKLVHPATGDSVDRIELLWNASNPSKFELCTVLMDVVDKDLRKIEKHTAIACRGSDISQEERIYSIIKILSVNSTFELSPQDIREVSSWIEILYTLIKDRAERELEKLELPTQVEIEPPIPTSIARKIFPLFESYREELSIETRNTLRELTSLAIASEKGELFQVYPLSPSKLVAYAESLFEEIDANGCDEGVMDSIRNRAHHLIKHAQELNPNAIAIMERVGDICRFGIEKRDHIEAVGVYKAILRREPENVRVKIALASLLYESAFFHLNGEEASREKTQKAQELLGEACDEDPENIYAKLLLARTYLEKRPGAKYDPEEAKELVQRCGSNEETASHPNSVNDSLTREFDLLFDYVQSPPDGNRREQIEEAEEALPKLAIPLFDDDVETAIAMIDEALHSSDLTVRAIQLSQLILWPQSSSHMRSMVRSVDIWVEFLGDVLGAIRGQNIQFRNDDQFNFSDLDETIKYIFDEYRDKESKLFLDYISLRYGISFQDGSPFTHVREAISTISSAQDVLPVYKYQHAEIILWAAKQHINQKIDSVSTQELNQAMLTQEVKNEIISIAEASLMSVPGREGALAPHIARDVLHSATAQFGKGKDILVLYAKALYLCWNEDEVSEGQELLQRLHEQYPEDIQIMKLLAQTYKNPRAGAEQDYGKALDLLEKAVKLLEQKE